ncbi:serine/threonine-protein kinase [Roseateles sp. BYS78W]|uniref:Serine/threonine-protein kinase n=1 Tax=Pelomonas candidula TaxID=3299025 RepID=A0ABW7H705_9BURK
MKPADWQRLSQLFDELAELPAAERRARLAAMPPAQAAQLSRMLSELPDDGPATVASIFGFQRQLAGALNEPAPPAREAPKAGDRFGAWCLAELLGEGGMGQVWRAERADGLYQGEAAIKLLRDDVAGAGVAARFARERALLGRLTHPGIARLLDAGEQHGRVFLVLEYVAGKTLSEHARGLPLAERVKLLVSVASAVEYAHAQLIVHRDLKPSNVMVDDRGAPKLLDFGIAGLLDDSGQQSDNALTQLTGRRLTPAYAAPEQITGETIGVAADIYSLGVMLHELATGVLPFSGSSHSRTALEHAVVHQEARRISQSLDQASDETLSGAKGGPGCPPDADEAAGDLEAVVAKALRKNPAERYASVGALIDDLQRWLQQRPVSVRAEDWRHRVHLWARRNAAVALGGGLVLAALSAGLAVSLWQRSAAQAAARQSEQVTGYLTELLAAASPDQNGGRQPTVVELLDRKRQELQTRFNDEPEVKDRILDTLAQTYHTLQRFDVAAPLAEQRLALARKAFGDDDPRTEDATIKLAAIHTAVASAQPVIDLLAPLLPRLDERDGQFNDQSFHLRLQLLGAYARLGRFTEAEREFALARRANDALNANDGFEHAGFATQEAVLFVQQGRLAEAEHALEVTRPFWRAAEPERLRASLVLERNYAFVHWKRAAESATAATARSDDLVRRWDAMARPGNHASTLMRQQLAIYLQQLGEFDAALAQLARAQADTEAAGADDAVTGQLRRIQLLEARVLAAGGADDAAVKQAAKALAGLDAAPLIGDARRAEGLLMLGRVALAPGAGTAGQALARELQARLDALRPVLAQARNLSTRIALFKARLAGTPEAWLAAARERVAYFDALPEPQGLPEWTARLQLACALRASGQPAADAQARADGARPSNLRALTATPHPLLDVATRSPADCDWRF